MKEINKLHYFAMAVLLGACLVIGFTMKYADKIDGFEPRMKDFPKNWEQMKKVKHNALWRGHFDTTTLETNTDEYWWKLKVTYVEPEVFDSLFPNWDMEFQLQHSKPGSLEYYEAFHALQGYKMYYHTYVVDGDTIETLSSESDQEWDSLYHVESYKRFKEMRNWESNKGWEVSGGRPVLDLAAISHQSGLKITHQIDSTLIKH